MSEIEKVKAVERIKLDEYPRDAGGVLALVVDNFVAKQVPVPRAHLAILGRHVKQLLDDGFEFETVVVASAVALRRGAPQHLQYIASDVVMARAGQHISRRQYEQMLQDEMEVGRE